MRSKKKGISAERELLHLFWQKGWAAARVAGSGSISKPSCDLLVGKGKRKFAVECKASRSDKKYIAKEQIEELKKFASVFGLKPLIAIKFLRRGWFFLEPEKLQVKEKEYVISLELAKKKGKKLEELG